MANHPADKRNPDRLALDEAIAAEPPLPTPELPADAAPVPMEALLGRIKRRPFAVTGIVENGLIRPLDPNVKFAERARVIIVGAEDA